MPFLVHTNWRYRKIQNCCYVIANKHATRLDKSEEYTHAQPGLSTRMLFFTGVIAGRISPSFRTRALKIIYSATFQKTLRRSNARKFFRVSKNPS
jgi:hypothetical protein